MNKHEREIEELRQHAAETVATLKQLNESLTRENQELREQLKATDAPQNAE